MQHNSESANLGFDNWKILHSEPKDSWVVLLIKIYVSKEIEQHLLPLEELVGQSYPNSQLYQKALTVITLGSKKPTPTGKPPKVNVDQHK